MRNVLVTGGSRGLGLGIAQRACRAGYRVHRGVARRQATSSPPRSRMPIGTQPGSLHFVPCDLAEVEKIPDLVKTLRKQFGPIYGLVNNAAIGFDGPLALMRNSQIEQLLRVNTLSPIMLTKYVVRAMMAEAAGASSISLRSCGFTGYSGLSVYGATKASLLGFTRSLAREVGRMGVNVNAVAPGFMDTEMTQSMTEAQRGQIARRSALRRFPEIEDVANAVEYPARRRRPQHLRHRAHDRCRQHRLTSR